MKPLIIVVVLIISPLITFSIDTIDSIRYRYAENAPKYTSIIPLVKYLKKGASTERKIVETFFYWIAINIEYDVELKNKTDANEYVTVDSILTRKKTICAGYSKLLFEMCKIANIQCIIIEGIAQSYIEPSVNSINHAWNAVLINKKWELVDVTWGSGGSLWGGDTYIKNLDTRYLFSETDFFLIDHFPIDQKWQLIKKPITLEEYQGKKWHELRFRKFNDLLDEDAYKEHLKR